jgi:hypothetical protein
MKSFNADIHYPHFYQRYINGIREDTPTHSLFHDYNTLFNRARDLELEYSKEEFERKRLQAENEFLLRWINSRINDDFKRD